MPMGALNPIDKHVGSRVRMRRLMLDMSQTDLGNAMANTAKAADVSIDGYIVGKRPAEAALRFGESGAK